MRPTKRVSVPASATLTRRAGGPAAALVVAVTGVALALFLLAGGPASAGRDQATPSPTATVSSATFVVTGRGWGHGVGMSQWGALGYAKRGFRYDRILARYFPGTVLTRAPVSRVRVLLVEGRRRLTISSAASFRVRDGRGKTYRVRAGEHTLGAALKVKVDGDRTPRALRGPLTFLPGQVPLTLGRPYRGSIQVAVTGRKLRAINVVGLEAYLYGVVPDEVPSTWPAEALKAQAVAARSYALATRKSGAFDLFADTRSQVYGGVDAETFPTTAAVDATAGQILAYRGEIAVTYFFSTSGGRTAAIQDAWPGTRPVPYLVSVPDPYDAASPHHRWGPLTFSGTGVARKLKLRALPHDLRTSVNPSRRVSSVLVVTGSKRLALSATDVRRALGLRSTWFRIGVLSLVRPQAPASYGSAVELRGVARGFSAVSLEQREGAAAWRRAGRLSPAPDGSFAVPVAPRVTTAYRLAASRVKGATIRVPVAPVLRFYPVTSRAALQGRMRPVRPGTTVEIQRARGSRWETVATASVDTSGDFEARVRLVPGLYRAAAAPGGGLVRGISPTLRVVQ